MNEYEQAAFDSVERLKEKHLAEIKETHEKIKRDLGMKFKLSKDLVEMRRQEKTYFTLKDY